ARLSPARSDFDRGSSAASRALEPAGPPLRLGGARSAALAGTEAGRVGRVSLAGRGPAAPEGADAASRPAAGPAAAALPEGERVLPPPHPPRAGAPRSAPLARDRRSPAGEAGAAPLVGRAEDGADTRRAERPRGGRGRRPPGQAAGLGPRRAVVSGDRDGAARAGAADDGRQGVSRARRQARARPPARA